MIVLREFLETLNFETINSSSAKSANDPQLYHFPAYGY